MCTFRELFACGIPNCIVLKHTRLWIPFKGCEKIISQDAIPKNSTFIVSPVLIICMGEFPDASCCFGIIVASPNLHFSIQVLTFRKKLGDTFRVHNVEFGMQGNRVCKDRSYVGCTSHCGSFYQCD